MAVGSIGEFGPIVLVALVLSGQNPGITGLLLLAFAALAAVSALAARRPFGHRITLLVRRVRLSLLLIVTMEFLASHLDLDVPGPGAPQRRGASRARQKCPGKRSAVVSPARSLAQQYLNG